VSTAAANVGKLSGTNENLRQHAIEPLMRWLIPVALDSSTMTYGEVKRRLEVEENFSTIFSIRPGFAAGSLMEHLERIDPAAPLINVLVVDQKTRQPSEGAGSFMARRFAEPRLARDLAKQAYPVLWKECFDRAAGEVYEYTAEQWAELYRRAFGRQLTIERIQRGRSSRKIGTEKDGLPSGRRYGAGGEGPFHKSLRLWVKDNPQALRRAFAGVRAETEVDLESGDRVDAVYFCEDRTVVIEVKSRISNDVDLMRGVYQCIKYRAVKQAMDVRGDAMVEAFLVTESEVSGEIAALMTRHGIKHFKAPLERE
jgi:hypothetical protein